MTSLAQFINRPRPWSDAEMTTSPFLGHEAQERAAHVTPSMDVPSPTLVGSTLAETTEATLQRVLVSISRDTTLPLNVFTPVTRDLLAHGSPHLTQTEPIHTELAQFESLSFNAMLNHEDVPITSLPDTTLSSRVQGESTQAQPGRVPSPTGLEEHAHEAHLSVSHTCDPDQVTGVKTSHVPTDEGHKKSNPNDSGNPSAPATEGGVDSYSTQPD